MYTLENTMPLWVDQRLLAAGEATPQHEYKMIPPVTECLDGGIGKCAPP